jgi:hypothetical protein
MIFIIFTLCLGKEKRLRKWEGKHKFQDFSLVWKERRGRGRERGRRGRIKNKIFLREKSDEIIISSF